MYGDKPMTIPLDLGDINSANIFFTRNSDKFGSNFESEDLPIDLAPAAVRLQNPQQERWQRTHPKPCSFGKNGVLQKQLIPSFRWLKHMGTNKKNGEFTWISGISRVVVRAASMFTVINQLLQTEVSNVNFMEGVTGATSKSCWTKNKTWLKSNKNNGHRSVKWTTSTCIRISRD